MRPLVAGALLLLSSFQQAEAQRRKKDFPVLVFGQASLLLTATTASDSGPIVEISLVRRPALLTAPFQPLLIRQWIVKVDSIVALRPKVVIGETLDLPLPDLPPLEGALELHWNRAIRSTGSTYSIIGIDRFHEHDPISSFLTTAQMNKLLAALRDACDYADRMSASP